MKKPLAVVISDIHYTLSTLEVADTSLRMAVDKAAELDVPLIDCGDITDSKAIIRAEVMNKLLATRDYAQSKGILIISLVGNHSLVSERSTDANALGFLPSETWDVVSHPTPLLNFGFIPYQPDPEEFDKAIRKFPKNSIVFAHQGYIGGDTGDYINDRSAVLPEEYSDWKVFSGHYHTHNKYLNWVSVGNPYTLNYGEANNPEKGFLVVYDDGSFDKILTHQRRHHVVEMTFDDILGYPLNCAMEHPLYYVKPVDYLWLKIVGTRSQLSRITKREIGKILGKEDYKLDLIQLDNTNTESFTKKLTIEDTLDKLVEELNEPNSEKTYLKQLWRDILAS
jgi:hypothetical protein